MFRGFLSKGDGPVWCVTDREKTETDRETFITIHWRLIFVSYTPTHTVHHSCVAQSRETADVQRIVNSGAIGRRDYHPLTKNKESSLLAWNCLVFPPPSTQLGVGSGVVGHKVTLWKMLLWHQCEEMNRQPCAFVYSAPVGEIAECHTTDHLQYHHHKWTPALFRTIVYGTRRLRKNSSISWYRLISV